MPARARLRMQQLQGQLSRRRRRENDDEPEALSLQSLQIKKSLYFEALTNTISGSFDERSPRQQGNQRSKTVASVTRRQMTIMILKWTLFHLRQKPSPSSSSSTIGINRRTPWHPYCQCWFNHGMKETTMIMVYVLSPSNRDSNRDKSYVLPNFQTPNATTYSMESVPSNASRQVTSVSAVGPTLHFRCLLLMDHQQELTKVRDQ